MAESVIPVVLCDDHRIVREGLKQMLADDFRIRVIAEASTGEELMVLVTNLVHDGVKPVLMLDIALPGQDGLTMLKSIRERWPLLPVLMLSTYPEKQYAVRCIQLGASGYVHKSADPDVMMAAVLQAANGERYLSAATAQALAAAAARRHRFTAAAEGIPALSHREHQVFQRLIEGQAVTQIGAALGLAANTVSTYRARILEKTGARNDVELALLAERHGHRG
ncbi:response regulator transcription factor [Ottowia sp. VDI28]|uniref:response regulator transcription factor n=1 Tax=Ottowia sp. VDI28 TaxID=3133968 RepID=UPI003C2B6C0A